MERRGSFSGASALTKSAAWGWLERRSGPNSRLTPEFNVSRVKFEAGPSRHKAEAMRKIQENSNSIQKIDTSATKSIQSEGYYSLLDRYEVETISRQLDYYIESSRASRGGSRRAEAAAKADSKSKHGGGKKVAKGLWLGSHAPLACGSARGEVVDSASIEYLRRPRRSSEKRRAAAEVVVGCRPRQGIRA